MSNVIWKISDITTTHLVKWPRLTAENTACGRKILTYNQQTRAKIIPNVALLNNNPAGWLGPSVSPGSNYAQHPAL